MVARGRRVVKYPRALTPWPAGLYIVRMKKVTASDARRQWFRLLDEAAEGEVIVVERKGRRLVLRREDAGKRRAAPVPAAYRRLLRVPRAEQADRWSWTWTVAGGLQPRRARGR
jgi:antitoxin (DNA-binding transcriptional repressor) of toxin-antitoxin stability system